MQLFGMLMQAQAASQASAASREMGMRRQVLAGFEAAQLEQQAGQEVAASQRVALDRKREGDLVASRVLALAAAGGGGVSDPTIVHLMGKIASEQQYRQSMALYEGEDKSRVLRLKAAARRYEGESAARAGELEAKATETSSIAGMFSGGGSMLSKYGGGGPGLVQEQVPGQFSTTNPAYG